MLVVGDREAEAGTVSVRHRKHADMGAKPLEQFVEEVCKLVESKSVDGSNRRERILSPTSGFIAEAGFTHSLTPARNCTFGCTYCYVPTHGIYGGLKPEDWQRWGQFTTFKINAAELLRRELRPDAADLLLAAGGSLSAGGSRGADDAAHSGCADRRAAARVRIADARAADPARSRPVAGAGAAHHLRVSFSITTNREDVRKLYEPHCATIEERLDVIRALRDAGIETYATLAPLLPCDPEELARAGASKPPVAT